MKFSETDLASELKSNLESINFIECTAVQAEVIPAALEGKDISALSQTGTGKTAAFLLPLMDRIHKSIQGFAEAEGLTEEEKALREKRCFPQWKKGQFALVLVPTRELAEQVYQDFYKLRGETQLEAVSVYGGTSYEEQKSKLGQGVQFVIGTPGRLIDLYKTNTLDLRQVRAIVFDEADRMFDMGFKEDMRFILQRAPKDRQILMFSATMNFDVLHTAYRFGADPQEFNLSKDQAKAENVVDQILHVGQNDKPCYLYSLIKKENPRQMVIFSNYKSNVERLAQFLTQNGVPALGISSLLTQAQRNRVISQFKETNDQNILVATDVAARGLDIKNVDMVVNYDLPDDPENYVHRIGRTGRAGASGKAFSLVSDRDVDALVRVEEYLKHKIEIGWLEDSELIRDFKPMPAYSDREKPSWAGKPQEARGPRGERGDRGRRDGPPRGDRPARGQDPRRSEHRSDRPARPRPEGGAAAPSHPRGEQRAAGGQKNFSRGPNGKDHKHGQRHQGAEKKNFQKKHQGQRRHQKPEGLSRRPLPAAKSGVLQKVTGFFKKLFT